MCRLAANKQGVSNTRSKVCVRRESFGEEDGKRGQNRSSSQRSDFILFIFKNPTKSKTDGWSACNLHHFRIMWVVNCILFDLDVSRRMCRVIQCLCIKKPGVRVNISTRWSHQLSWLYNKVPTWLVWTWWTPMTVCYQACPSGQVSREMRSLGSLFTRQKVFLCGGQHQPIPVGVRGPSKLAVSKCKQQIQKTRKNCPRKYIY